MASKNEAKIVFKAVTDQFKSAIDQAKGTIGGLNAQLRLNSQEMAKGGNATQLLSQRVDLLSSKEREQQAVVENLEHKLEAARFAYGENSTEVQKLNNQLMNSRATLQSYANQTEQARQKLAQSKTAYGQTSQAIRQQESELKRLKQEYANVVVAEGRNSESAKELEGKIKSLSAELGENKEKLALADDAADKLGNSYRTAAQKSEELNRKIEKAGSGMQSAGQAMTMGITMPVIAAGAATVKAATDIDTSLTGVRKTVDGTEEQYQSLKDAAIEFSETNAVSASQILDIQALGAQLGFAIDELDEFGRVTSGLDIATNMNAEQAGTEMAQFANITKMAHSEVSNYASAVVGLGNTSATTESDISSMAMRIAAAGTQAGMSQADILGVSAALASMGVEAEAGGTAISTIMANIDKSVARGSDALKGWADQAGMSAEEFTSAMASNADQFKWLADSAGMTVKELSKAVLDNSDALSTWASTAGMSADEFSAAWKEDPVQALASVFSGMEAATEAGGNMSLMLEDLGIDSIRQTDIMKRLAGNSELVTKSVATANDEWEKNTALQNEVGNRNESLAAKFEILKNKVIAIADDVGGPLANALLDALDAAEPLIEAIAAGAETFADMDKEQQQAILTAAALAAALGPALNVSGKLVGTVGNLKEAFEKAGGSMSGMATKSAPMLAAALAAILIADLVSQFADYSDALKDAEGATDGMREAVNTAQANFSAAIPGCEAYAASLSDVHDKTRETTQAQADLAGRIDETWSGIGTDSALIQAHTDTIARLTSGYDENGNKAKLSADEQAQLQTAVAGLNEVCGTSYSVIDAQNGVLDTSTDAIKANSEAWVANAKAQAAQEALTDLYKQQIENKRQLAEVDKQLADAEEGWGLWIGDFPVLADEASIAHRDLENQKKTLEEQTESAADAEKFFQDELVASQNAIRGSATSISSFIASSETFASALDGMGVDTEALSAKLSELGFTTDDLSRMSAEQAQAMASSYQGGVDQIIAACDQAGIEVPEALRAMGASASAEAAAAGDGTGQSYASALAAKKDAAVASALEVTGMTVDKFAETASAAGIEGDAATAAFAAAIADGAPLAEAAATANASSSTGGFGTVDGQTPGAKGGSDFAGGIGSMAGLANAQASLVAQSGVAGLGSVDAAPTGSTMGAEFSGGIGSRSGDARTAGSGLASQAESGASSVDGSGAGDNFALGFIGAIGSWAQSAFNAAFSFVSSALAGGNAAQQSRSPAKKTKEMAKWNALGFIGELGEREEDAYRAGYSFVRASIAGSASAGGPSGIASAAVPDFGAASPAAGIEAFVGHVPGAQAQASAADDECLRKILKAIERLDDGLGGKIADNSKGFPDGRQFGRMTRKAVNGR